MSKKATKKAASPENSGRTTKPAGQDSKKPAFRLSNVPNRKDAEFNAQIIRAAFLKLITTKNGRKPTYEELAEATGLNRATVVRHVRRLKFEPEKSIFRVLTEDVIISIYQGAAKGSTRDKKLWLQLFEGFMEKTDLSSGGRPLGVDEARKIEKGMTEEQAAAIYAGNITGNHEDDD